MPENTLALEEKTGGLSEAQFNAVISRAETFYKPIFAQFGATLTVERLWSDDTVNAFADQPSATDWQVHMFGGLARRPEVSEDAFTMVLCHEMGHHLSGYPFVSSTDWAANEGQADMHATGPCAARLFAENDLASRHALETITPSLKAQCDAAYGDAFNRDVCYRSVVAGNRLANLLAALEGATVSADTPDTSTVTVTDSDHPKAQCRLDTYVASALCGSSRWNYALIPGKSFADRNSAEAQGEAFLHSCQFGVGARPRCWFAPL